MAKKTVRRKRANRKSMKFVVIGAVILSVFLIAGIIRQKTVNDSLALQEAALQENVTAESERADELNSEKDKGLTEKDIIRIAREKFGLIFKNEILFIPDED